MTEKERDILEKILASNRAMAEEQRTTQAILNEMRHTFKDLLEQVKITNSVLNTIRYDFKDERIKDEQRRS
jgi:hypothetical protein